MRTLWEAIQDTDERTDAKMVAFLAVQRLLNHKSITKDAIQTLEKQVAVWKPDSQDDLYDVIDAYVKYAGNRCSLNWIDTSDCTDFTDIFLGSSFNGDISKWNTSKVTTLNSSFTDSKFNGDISDWDVSNVRFFNGTFAQSVFNRDLKKWKVSKGEYFTSMFKNNTKFDKNISNWDMGSAADVSEMFDGCPIRDEYKPAFT